MRAILVGCGRAGAELASRLARAGHMVTVIDVAADAFDNLPADFLGHVIQAEAMNEDVLVNAGIEKADCVATLTNSDALNAVIGHIAATVYHVPRVVVRNYDPRWAPLHEAFALQTVNSVQWNAERFFELLVNSDSPAVHTLGESGVALYDFVIPPAWAGRSTGALTQGEEAVVAAVTRSGRSSLPHPEMLLEAGDHVTLTTSAAGASRLRTRLYQGA